MASGRFGKATPAANADTDLYTAPPGMVTNANVLFCNRTNAPVTVRLAVRSAAIGDADYLEYGTVSPANGILERTGISMTPGEIITVRTSAAGVSVRAHGYEEEL